MYPRWVNRTFCMGVLRVLLITLEIDSPIDNKHKNPKKNSIQIQHLFILMATTDRCQIPYLRTFNDHVSFFYLNPMSAGDKSYLFFLNLHYGHSRITYKFFFKHSHLSLMSNDWKQTEIDAKCTAKLLP